MSTTRPCPPFLLLYDASCTPHPTSNYPPSQHHPNVPFTLSTRSQPNPGLQPHNKIYPLQLPSPFLPPHYPTIPSHRNDLLPTTTSTTHGTHPSSPSSSPSLIQHPPHTSHIPIPTLSSSGKRVVHASQYRHITLPPQVTCEPQIRMSQLTCDHTHHH